MSAPAPIRGRWTLKPHSHPFVSATLEGPRVIEPVAVVPVPDEHAIERAARKLNDVWPTTLDDSGLRALARAVLTAALEQPEGTPR